MRIWKLLLPLVLLCSPLAHADATLNANPGPANNGGSVGSGMFFDVTATRGIEVTGMRVSTSVPLGATFDVRVYTRDGTALGGTQATGPASSPAGWTLRGTVTGTQGDAELSLPIALPRLHVSAGRTLGVALEFIDTNPRYFGSGTPPIETYGNGTLTLRTGEARSAPFTTAGSFFSSRALVGSLSYRLADPELAANPGPDNNGGNVDSGLFFNLQSSSGAQVNGLEIASTAVTAGMVQLDVYTRSGTALGNTPTTGPASSPAGWTLHATINGVQGGSQISQPIAMPPLTVPAGQTVGVGVVFRSSGPSYFGVGSAPIETYSTPGLVLTTGEAMSAPFTTGGTLFASRALVGKLFWHPLRATLPASDGPSNNTGNVGAGMFFNLNAAVPLNVTALRLATGAAPDGTFQVRMFTRAGSALGSTAATGPASSSSGWTLHATLSAVQDVAGEVSRPVPIPTLPINAGETVGVGLVFDDTFPRYRGTGVSAVASYGNGALTVVTGETKSTPFVTGGNFFVSRELIGTIYYDSGDDGIFANGFE